MDVLSKVGGLEIAGLAGLILGAAAAKVPVVLDGFISGAAALVAKALAPDSVHYMIASHISGEQGHKLMLERLGLTALLDLGLRLGEGTGGVLCLHLIEAASRIMREMATFESAGVSGAESR
ncbi:Nicotinate-nucleotide--dimethylbenzimidazole phosphoribosyltransferase [compost metagenome]